MAGTTLAKCLARCLRLIAISCIATAISVGAAPAADVPVPIPNAGPPDSACAPSGPPRTSVVRKPRGRAPCEACPPSATPCVSCQCDVGQLIDKLEINTTNVTNIDKRVQSLNVGLESLLRLNASLPNIVTGLALIKTDVAWLSDIRLNLQTVQSDVTLLRTGQSNIAAIQNSVSAIAGNVTRIDNSLTAVNTNLDSLLKLVTGPVSVGAALAAIQNNAAVLAEMRLMLQRIQLEPLAERLSAVLSTLRQIEANTRQGAPPGPQPSPGEPKSAEALRCLKSGEHVYFMGPLRGLRSRCVGLHEWERLLQSYRGSVGNLVVGSVQSRVDLCNSLPEGRGPETSANDHGEPFSSDFLTALVAEAKGAKLPQGIRLAGVMAYEPISITAVEAELPLAIEQGTFCKDVRIEKSKFSRTVSFDGSVFLQDLTLANSTFGENFHIRDAVARSVKFLSTKANGTVDLSGSVAARTWFFIGAEIGQLDAANADLRDIDLTDSEIKRRFSADGIRVRDTLLLQGSTAGSDIDLTNARLTHTTIRRSTIKSDLRLKHVEARCSTKVHKSRIEGDLAIEDYHFGSVDVAKNEPPNDGAARGRFQWVQKKKKEASSELTEQELARMFPSGKDESKGNAEPRVSASLCEIVAAAKPDDPQPPAIYRSSGVLDLVDSAVGGSVCINNVYWQKGLQDNLHTRRIEGTPYFDTQNVISFNGSAVAKYTILGVVKHPDEQGQSNNPGRSQFARMQMIGFKTNGLMLNEFRTDNEYKKVISRLDVDAVLKAQAGCPLDDIGFSPAKTPTFTIAGVLGALTKNAPTAPGGRAGAAPAATPEPASQRNPGAGIPTDRELVAWLSNAQPQTTQPYAAFIGALTRSGIEPTELRVRKSWMDLDSEWETWTSNLRGPTGDEDIWDYSLVAFNQVTDLAQLGVRWMHGHASGFGLRPARSLGIAILLVLIIWTVLRLYHGRVAFLSVPKKELDEPNPTEARLLIFKKHSTEWRVISLPVVVRMMIPHALTSVPLLGSMFSGATFNWSENSIVGFRRADKVDKDERISKEGVPAQSSTRWKSITREQEELKVELPHKAPPLSYLKIRLETGREQIRQLSAARRTVDEPKTTPSAENLDPVHKYLPGLIAMPQSGRLLATLRRWSRIGLIATAILVSGLIALFRF